MAAIAEEQQTPKKVDVVGEMWKVFSYYSLHGDPLHAEHIQSKQFVNLLSDGKVFDKGGPLVPADAQVTYRTVCMEVKKKKMTFGAFLNALQNVATKLYPKEEGAGGFQKLIKVNILAHCKRRQPLDISAMLSDKEVRVLQRKFSPGLKRLFQYYATGSPANTSPVKRRSSLSRKRQAAKAKANGSKSYDEINSMMSQLSYKGYMTAYASDFLGTLELSKFDLGDTFISSSKVHPGSAQELPGISYPEFWESIVRCALVAFAKYDGVSTVNKLKELLSVMGNQVPNCVPRAVNAVGRASNAVNGESLLHGAKMLQMEVHKMWKEDGETGTYLAGTPAKAKSGLEMLSEMTL